MTESFYFYYIFIILQKLFIIAMITKLPQIHIIYDRYKKASPTRKAVVEIRITYNYKQKYISTGIWLFPKQWKNGKIINCPNIVEISKTLDTLISNIRKILYTMIQEGNINLFSITNKLRELEKGEETFIGFCERKSKIRKYGKCADTQKRYDRFLRMFLSWGKIIKFEDVNEDNILMYDEYLRSKNMKPYSIWNNYHRFLNSFIKDAIEEGRLKKNPYKKIRIKKDKYTSSIDKCLTKEEFNRIIDTPMPTQALERVKDLFIFQSYTCMSYSDMKAFDVKSIELIRGMSVYTGKRKKTGKSFTIPLLKGAMEVVEKYNWQLPIISNMKYNEYLKVVAQAAGINKPVSTHWARHTGATMLLNEGIPMHIVSRICGHSSMKITEQIYAKLLDETVVDTLLETGNINNI